jgi:hypothetical protein
VKKSKTYLSLEHDGGEQLIKINPSPNNKSVGIKTIENLSQPSKSISLELKADHKIRIQRFFE